MPQASVMEEAIPSPAEMVLDMIESIFDEPKMDVHEKLGMLRELCLERVSFDSPEQAIKIISMLADIISSDPNPEVRVAALDAMERMIGLEEKAEAEGKPAVDWRKINLLLHKAKKQTALDTIAVAARAGAPAPEKPTPQPAQSSEKARKAFAVSTNEASPETHAISRDDNDIAPAEAALLAVQENAVAAVKQAHVPVAPPSAEMLAAGPTPKTVKPRMQSGKSAANISPIPDRPQPASTASATVEEKPEPPIMKFLRSIADTDDEEHIRDLAHRIIGKIESLTALPVSAPSSPALTDG